MPIEDMKKKIREDKRNWGDKIEAKPYTQTGKRSCHRLPKLATPSTSKPNSSDNALDQDLDNVVGSEAREDDHQAESDNDQHAINTRQPGMISTRNWSLDGLQEGAPNFHFARRVSWRASNLSELVAKHEKNGTPLVIEQLHEHHLWPKDLFNLDQFQRGVPENINVRNVHDRKDKMISISDFVQSAHSSGHYTHKDEKERLYGKDSPCPKEWETWLKFSDVVPSNFLPNGPQDIFRYRPHSVPVETLMCYLGNGDTFTPCHKDLCASSGQNLMCYTEDGGSAYWFMTDSSSAPTAAQYFQTLGQELDHENHLISVEELAKAPFKIYIIQQKLGDLVYVPPRSSHQVVNSGGITIKTSWSRMTLNGLLTAYYHELPIYRRVCRMETYQIKSTICHTVIAKTDELNNSLGAAKSVNETVTALATDLQSLLSVFASILDEERPVNNHGIPPLFASLQVFSDADATRFVCDFCGADIFQSFFECSACVNNDCVHVCPGCYVEGRSCQCPSMKSKQYVDFSLLDQILREGKKSIREYEARRGEMFNGNTGLQQESTPALFYSACLLNDGRISKQNTRICNLSRNVHEVPYHWLLHCKQCHHSTCFYHMLKRNIHSAEALLKHRSDGTHRNYHKWHMEAKNRYSEGMESLTTSQKNGSRPDGHALLVYNAKRYGANCRPNNQIMKNGWYDGSFSGCDLTSTSHPRLTIVLPPSLTNAVSADIVANSDTSRKRKRQPYVLVPSAPYLTCGSNIQSNAKLISPVLNSSSPKAFLNSKAPLSLQKPPSVKRVPTNQSSTNLIPIRSHHSEPKVTGNHALSKPHVHLTEQPAKRAKLNELHFKKIAPATVVVHSDNHLPVESASIPTTTASLHYSSISSMNPPPTQTANPFNATHEEILKSAILPFVIESVVRHTIESLYIRNPYTLSDAAFLPRHGGVAESESTRSRYGTPYGPPFFQDHDKQRQRSHSTWNIEASNFQHRHNYQQHRPLHYPSNSKSGPFYRGQQEGQGFPSDRNSRDSCREPVRYSRKHFNHNDEHYQRQSPYRPPYPKQFRAPSSRSYHDRQHFHDPATDRNDFDFRSEQRRPPWRNRGVKSANYTKHYQKSRPNQPLFTPRAPEPGDIRFGSDTTHIDDTVPDSGKDFASPIRVVPEDSCFLGNNSPNREESWCRSENWEDNYDKSGEPEESEPKQIRDEENVDENGSFSLGNDLMNNPWS